MNPLGRYIDNDGEWDVFRNTLLASYELRQGDKVKQVAYETIDQHCRLGYYAGMLNAWKAPKPTKRTLDQRWRDRMLRMKEKATERRLRAVVLVAWYFACIWGFALAFVLTTYLLRWLTYVVLG